MLDCMCCDEGQIVHWAYTLVDMSWMCPIEHFHSCHYQYCSIGDMCSWIDQHTRTRNKMPWMCWMICVVKRDRLCVEWWVWVRCAPLRVSIAVIVTNVWNSDISYSWMEWHWYWNMSWIVCGIMRDRWWVGHVHLWMWVGCSPLRVSIGFHRRWNSRIPIHWTICQIRMRVKVCITEFFSNWCWDTGSNEKTNLSIRGCETHPKSSLYNPCPADVEVVGVLYDY